MGYDLVLNESSLDVLLLLSPGRRERLLQSLKQLADNPHAEGDFSEMDAGGRVFQVACFDRWVVTSWADHAVKEFRIVRIEVV